MTAPTADSRQPIANHCVHRAPLRPESQRRMTLALGITAAVMVIELVGGLLANSLALLADAGHMLADVVALALALWVSHMAQRPATPERTYGLLRLEILAALVNGAFLIVIAVGIGIEAVERLRTAPPIDGRMLVGVALIGLVANVVAATILHRGHQHSMNQRAAYLHVLGDLLGSVGALVAGAVVLATGWTAADPLISVAIGALILGGAWRLVRESVDVLLEATPRHIALADVHNRLATVSGVASVHDLHVWTVTSGVVAMSGHLVVRDPGANQRVLVEAQALMTQLGIDHVTVQIENDPTC
jgi:cobalt-zinc-cadmium efflux system protein